MSVVRGFCPSMSNLTFYMTCWMARNVPVRGQTKSARRVVVTDALGLANPNPRRNGRWSGSRSIGFGFTSSRCGTRSVLRQVSGLGSGFGLAFGLAFWLG